MIKMVMNEERLKEVTEMARIGLPEEEYAAVLARVNAVLRMCDEMQELEHSSVKPFEWDVKKAPERRKDESSVWRGRDPFLEQAPVSDGDFFRVPRIIALQDSEEEGGE